LCVTVSNVVLHFRLPKMKEQELIRDYMS
jgi:hypothetical protein